MKRFTLSYGKYKDNLENIEYDEKWESWKICELLNNFDEETENLKQQNQDYEDCVSNWFIENWEKLDDNLRSSAHLELGMDFDYDD